MSESFKPVAYIKEGCPFSMRLLQFITEEQLTDRVDVVRCATGTSVMQAVREKIEAATGHRAKFPTMEVEPGEFRSESDELIDYLDRKYVAGPH